MEQDLVVIFEMISETQARHQARPPDALIALSEVEALLLAPLSLLLRDLGPPHRRT